MPRDSTYNLSDAPALPRLHAAQHRALTKLYDSAPVFAWKDNRISGELRCVYFDRPPLGLETWGRCRLKIGSHMGTLAFDSVGLCDLLDEPQAALLPGDLRLILIAQALQPVVQAIESVLRVRLDWQIGEGPELLAHEAVIGFELRTDGQRPALHGLARLDDPAALEALLPALLPRRPGSVDRFDRLRMPLPFELGLAWLSLLELRQVTAGDVIGIERWTAFGSALRVTATVGGPHGLVLSGLADGVHITLDSIGEPAMNPHDRSASQAPSTDDAGLQLDRLDALQVVVRFEVGELSVSLGDLRSLRPGHVFELDQPLNRSTVRILAHGNLLGKGSLVAIGDRLGVRVSEFAVGAL